jgi:hypothetical protein
MINCEFPPDSVQRTGDTRKFKKGEPLCIKNDRYYTEGIYDHSYSIDGTRPYGHYLIVTNSNGSRDFRHIMAKNVGKRRYSVSPTAMGLVLREKTGIPNLENYVRQQGYGKKRKTRKTKNRKHKKTRKAK